MNNLEVGKVLHWCMGEEGKSASELRKCIEEGTYSEGTGAALALLGGNGLSQRQLLTDWVKILLELQEKLGEVERNPEYEVDYILSGTPAGGTREGVRVGSEGGNTLLDVVNLCITEGLAEVVLESSEEFWCLKKNKEAIERFTTYFGFTGGTYHDYSEIYKNALLGGRRIITHWDTEIVCGVVECDGKQGKLLFSPQGGKVLSGLSGSEMILNSEKVLAGEEVTGSLPVEAQLGMLEEWVEREEPKWVGWR